MGFEMGAKADTERYCLVLDARYVHSAPWPPILWPKMDTRERSCAADSARVDKGCQCSRWVERHFPELQESRVGCVCACCSGERTLDLWRSSRSPRLRRITTSRRSAFIILVYAVPVPKSQSSFSPSIPAPRGELSVKSIAMPSLAAGPRKFP